MNKISKAATEDNNLNIKKHTQYVGDSKGAVDLSIIMPVYNSEAYVGKTIETILSQSYDSFELIVVDDGSKDGSGTILDEYAAKDSRVKVFHKANEGICATRNYGLSRAIGEYIGFCDNDDVFLENHISDNMALAKRYNADVVRFSRRVTTIMDDKVISEDNTKGYPDTFYSSEDFVKGFRDINKTGEGVWAGIYRRSFLKEHGITFDETMRFGYEDLDFINHIYSHRPSVALNTKVYYNWIMRYAHSTSGKTDINNLDSLIKCLNHKGKMLKSYGILEEYPLLWPDELSKRIYTMVRYVSPLKVKMKLKDRLEYIKHFAKADCFKAFKKQMNEDNEPLKAFRKSNKIGYLVLILFLRKNYLLLYLLITGKQRVTG
ncbi:MAG: glycosyltransferase family 2 protein [Lachnospiraceae bacterium]|nr:glycosyltransferase family 2 protein [Lachnospiraceae bacterium]